MATNSNSLIEREVDRLFARLNATHGECCINPVTRGGFVWGLDPIAEQREYATIALLAREWFAVNGPSDAPPLPLYDVDSYRNARGLKGVVGFYARSLSRQKYDVCKHPPFDDFARGLMALATERGLWSLENDASLIRRFPPRPLVGMTPSAYWDPHEEYCELEARSRVTAAGRPQLRLISSRRD
jgi:hypothetical protein